MIGSAMRNPRIQPGPGLGQGRFDDGRADDGDGQQVAVLGHQSPFAQSLGVRVGIGPSERLGPGLPDDDHLLLDPVLAQMLGSFGQQVQAGGAQLFAGLLGQGGQMLGPPRCGVEITALTSGRLDLVPPVHIHAEPGGAEQLLSGFALMGAGDVGGGHR